MVRVAAGVEVFTGVKVAVGIDAFIGAKRSIGVAVRSSSPNEYESVPAHADNRIRRINTDMYRFIALPNSISNLLIGSYLSNQSFLFSKRIFHNKDSNDPLYGVRRPG
jgi:hypothetical protein